MNHYVYKITNNINSKIYIGKRSCKCDIQDDKYFGSGIALKSAIKKYGIDNFSKTIIDICETAEQAYELEALIVDTDFLKRADTYNLCGGGIGVGLGECHPMFGKQPIFSDSHKIKISLANSKEKNANYGKPGTMLNKHHTEESKHRMSESNSGSRNSQYGKKWIYSIIEEKSVRINSDADIPEGWLLGRKIKF